MSKIEDEVSNPLFQIAENLINGYIFIGDFGLTTYGCPDGEVVDWSVS